MSPEQAPSVPLVRGQRGLTADQLKLDRRRFDEAEFFVTGRLVRLAKITDGECIFRISTHGYPYLEDGKATYIYGAEKLKSTTAWKATVFLRATMESVLNNGTIEPQSLGDDRKKRPGHMPSDVAPELTWMDGGIDGYHPYLTVHNDCVRVSKPLRDAPSIVAWVKSKELVRKIKVAAKQSPKPYPLEKFVVRRRKEVSI